MGRPSYTDQQVQEGRRQLGEAALRLYRAKGYEAVTLRSLASEVGISSATPYRFFESKDALFEYVRADVYTHFAEHLKAADPGGGDPLIRLRRIAEGMLDFGLKFPEDYRLIFSMRQPPPQPGSRLHAVQKSSLDAVIPICQAIIDSGRWSGDARVQVHVSWAAIHGLISFHVSNQLIHGVSLQDIAGPMLDRLFAGSAGAGVARLPAGKASTAAPRPAKPGATAKRKRTQSATGSASR
jgi:AcrR family transcriptional regulator